MDKKQTEKRSRLKRKFWLVFLLAAIFIGSFEFYFYDKFYPGVVIGDYPAGGHTYAEVLAHFTAREKAAVNNGISLTVRNGNDARYLAVPMFAPGLTADNSLEYFSIGDVQQSVQKAYDCGRSGNLWDRVTGQFSLFSAKKFDLPVTVYSDAVASYAAREMETFLKKTKPAQFAQTNEGDIYIIREDIGESASLGTITDAIKKKIAALDTSSKTLAIKKDTILSTEASLKPFLGLAEEFSKQTNFVFTYKNRSWKVNGGTFATWLVIKENNGLGVDSDKLRSFLSRTVARVIDDAPEDSRFAIRGGKIVEIAHGKAGYIVDVEKTAQKVEKIIPGLQGPTIPSDNLAALFAAISPETSFNVQTGTIEVPVDVVKAEPAITEQTIQKYGINELVGTAQTSFHGSSADRINNITIGASKLNGLLIAPGEEFSTVNAIGRVDESGGYSKEYVIKDNKSIKEFGGGLCQIATTLFRAALAVGLPITERVNHRYTIKYYGAGLDATIYGPHPDLRFVNDTGHYLLLQSKVVGTEISFEFYGQKDGRQIAISEPVLSDEIPAPPTKYVPTDDLAVNDVQCSETPKDGVTANVDYTVTFPDGQVRRQHFTSVYEPWQKICLLGTNTKL